MQLTCPKISVIIPVYNSEKFLPKCIESVLKQSFTNFELILVDDGSTDDSVNICDSYAKQDKRITVIHSKNMGVSSTRNMGISIARGEWVIFIDSDDYIDEDMFKVSNDFFVLENDLIIFGFNFVNCEDKLLQHVSCADDYCCINDFINKYYKKFYINNILNSACGKFFKREIITKNNILFNEKFSICEDGLFVSDYLFYVLYIKCLDKAMYFYVQHNEFSLVKKFNYNALEARSVFLNSQKKLLLRKHANDTNLFDFIYGKSAEFYLSHILKLLASSLDKHSKHHLLNLYLHDREFRNYMKYYKSMGFKRKIMYLLVKMRMKKTLVLIAQIKSKKI